MSLYGWGDIRIGRTLLRETWDVTEAGGSSARSLALKGQESFPPNPRLDVVNQHRNLVALTSQVVPVTFTDKPEMDAYAMAPAISSAFTDWNGSEGGVTTATWTATLPRCGSGNDTDLQSRLTGAARDNDFSEPGVSFHAPPPAHYGYFTGANSPGSVVRATEDGAVRAYLGIPTGVMPKWGCEPAAYGGARARAFDGPYELEGIDRQAAPDAWSVGNALLRVSPGAAGGTLSIAVWDTAAYVAKDWDVSVGGVALGAADAATMVHNEYEHVVLRLTFNRTPGRTVLDIGLRRGAPFAELYLQTSTSATLAVKLHTAAAGTQTSGYVAATADDADGNKYVVGSARTFTADLVQGGLSRAASITLDAMVGVSVGGSAAAGGDAPGDLYAQYIGALPESVYAVRR